MCVCVCVSVCVSVYECVRCARAKQCQYLSGFLRSFPTLEGGMSAASFLHSSFLHPISAVMLWPAHVQKVPQACEPLCSAKLQTRCDICCACQSICPFIPTDSGVPRTVDPQKSLQPETVHGYVPVGHPFQTPSFAGGSLSL